MTVHKSLTQFAFLMVSEEAGGKAAEEATGTDMIKNQAEAGSPDKKSPAMRGLRITLFVVGIKESRGSFTCTCGASCRVLPHPSVITWLLTPLI